MLCAYNRAWVWVGRLLWFMMCHYKSNAYLASFDFVAYTIRRSQHSIFDREINPLPSFLIWSIHNKIYLRNLDGGGGKSQTEVRQMVQCCPMRRGWGMVEVGHDEVPSCYHSHHCIWWGSRRHTLKGVWKAIMNTLPVYTDWISYDACRTMRHLLGVVADVGFSLIWVGKKIYCY